MKKIEEKNKLEKDQKSEEIIPKIQSSFLFPHLSLFRSIIILFSKYNELNQLICNYDSSKDLFISLFVQYVKSKNDSLIEKLITMFSEESTKFSFNFKSLLSYIINKLITKENCVMLRNFGLSYALKQEPSQVGYSSFYELSAREIINYFDSQKKSIKQIVGLLPKFILYYNSSEPFQVINEPNIMAFNIQWDSSNTINKIDNTNTKYCNSQKSKENADRSNYHNILSVMATIPNEFIINEIFSSVSENSLNPKTLAIKERILTDSIDINQDSKYVLSLIIGFNRAMRTYENYIFHDEKIEVISDERQIILKDKEQLLKMMIINEIQPNILIYAKNIPSIKLLMKENSWNNLLLYTEEIENRERMDKEIYSKEYQEIKKGILNAHLKIKTQNQIKDSPGSKIKNNIEDKGTDKNQVKLNRRKNLIN